MEGITPRMNSPNSSSLLAAGITPRSVRDVRRSVRDVRECQGGQGGWRRKVVAELRDGGGRGRDFRIAGAGRFSGRCRKRGHSTASVDYSINARKCSIYLLGGPSQISQKKGLLSHPFQRLEKD
jgi:hypothetical protein